MTAYSFENFVASIVGPGGAFDLGAGTGVGEEGCTISMRDDKNTMTIGADGEGMHSLNPSKAGTITFRFLKTAPVNALLSNLYTLQTESKGLLVGQNIIVCRDVMRGDNFGAKQCAFKKFPDTVYNASGTQSMEWVFDCIKITPKLGSGAPSLTNLISDVVSGVFA